MAASSAAPISCVSSSRGCIGSFPFVRATAAPHARRRPKTPTSPSIVPCTPARNSRRGQKARRRGCIREFPRLAEQSSAESYVSLCISHHFNAWKCMQKNLYRPDAPSMHEQRNHMTFTIENLHNETVLYRGIRRPRPSAPEKPRRLARGAPKRTAKARGGGRAGGAPAQDDRRSEDGRRKRRPNESAPVDPRPAGPAGESAGGPPPREETRRATSLARTLRVIMLENKEECTPSSPAGGRRLSQERP